MMAGSIQAIVGALNPGEWMKDASAEENLKTFNRYVTRFERWMDVGEMNGFTDKQKWSLFIATGGYDLEDLVLHQGQVKVRMVPQVVAVPASPDQPKVVGMPAVVPTPWLAGIDLCRTAIRQYMNQIMARNKLFTKMPASNFADWRKWGQELLEQAKHCLWDQYGIKQAVLDAPVYQCPDEVWALVH